MSIVRVGLAETKGFGEGHDAIFGKKKAGKKAAAAKKAPARKAKPVKASAAKGKKKAKKK